MQNGCRSLRSLRLQAKSPMMLTRDLIYCSFLYFPWVHLTVQEGFSFRARDKLKNCPVSARETTVFHPSIVLCRFLVRQTQTQILNGLKDALYRAVDDAPVQDGLRGKAGKCAVRLPSFRLRQSMFQFHSFAKVADLAVGVDDAKMFNRVTSATFLRPTAFCCEKQTKDGGF